MEARSRLRWVLFLLPVPLSIACISCLLLFPETYGLRLFIEDGPLEKAQFIVFLIASAITFVAAIKLRRTDHRRIFWLFLIFAFGCLLLAGEEISWGQRFLETPEDYGVMKKAALAIAADNHQNETNVHNLRQVGGTYWLVYGLAGLYGSLAWLAIRNVKLGMGDLRRFIIPEWYCSLYFLPGILWFFLYYIICPGQGRWLDAHDLVDLERLGRLPTLYKYLPPDINHDETWELTFALGVLLVAIGNYSKAIGFNQKVGNNRLKLPVSDIGIAQGGHGVGPQSSSRPS